MCLAVLYCVSLSCCMYMNFILCTFSVRQRRVPGCYLKHTISITTRQPEGNFNFHFSNVQLRRCTLYHSILFFISFHSHSHSFILAALVRMFDHHIIYSIHTLQFSVVRIPYIQLSWVHIFTMQDTMMQSRNCRAVCAIIRILFCMRWQWPSGCSGNE